MEYKNPTFEQANKSFEEISKVKNLYDTLVSCGVPKKLVQYFRVPNAITHYSMGEITELFCGETKICAFDNREQYKGRKYQAKHGHIKFTLNKAELRKYCEIWQDVETLDEKTAFKDTAYWSERMKMGEAYTSLLTKHMEGKVKYDGEVMVFCYPINPKESRIHTF